MIKKTFSVLTLILLLSSCAGGPPRQKMARPLFVKVEKTDTKSITEFFETAAELKADKEVTVSAEKAAQIQNIYVSEGNYVQKATVLFKLKATDAEADLQKAQLDYASYKNLFEQGAVSRLELLSYETALKKAESVISNLEIKALFDGVVGQIYVDPGDYLRVGEPILQLVKTYPLRVSYNVPEKLIPSIHLGQSLELTTDALPGKTYNANVDFISPQIDPDSRTILIRAKVSNPDSLLKANQFLRVKQEIRSRNKVLMVKEEAIKIEQGQEYIYVAEALPEDQIGEPAPNGTPAPTHIAVRKDVRTGFRREGEVEIAKGLDLNIDYIVSGLNTIYPAAKLILVD